MMQTSKQGQLQQGYGSVTHLHLHSSVGHRRGLDTSLGWRYWALPLCDFNLRVHDVICVFPIYGPPHLSPGVLQKGKEDLTGQNKVISWEERTTVK